MAAGFPKAILSKGDEIIITQMEHHPNIIPWQMACDTSGASLKMAPFTENGEIELDALENLLSKNTKLSACRILLKYWEP